MHAIDLMEGDVSEEVIIAPTDPEDKGDKLHSSYKKCNELAAKEHIGCDVHSCKENFTQPDYTTTFVKAALILR